LGKIIQAIWHAIESLNGSSIENRGCMAENALRVDQLKQMLSWQYNDSAVLLAVQHFVAYGYAVYGTCQQLEPQRCPSRVHGMQDTVSSKG
jgi:hypothetical protein